MGAAGGVSNLLGKFLGEAAAGGIELPDPASRKLCPAARAALAPVIAALPPAVTDVAIQAGLMAWAGLLGTVSLELFGQFQNVIGENPGDRDAFFAECITRWAAEIGL